MTELLDEFEALTPSVAGTADSARAPRIGERVLEVETEWRPRGVGGVLDLGFDLLRTRFASCFILATLLWLPWRFLMMLIAPRMEKKGSGDLDDLVTIIAASWTSSALAWIAQSIVTAFVARLLVEAAFGREAGVAATLAFVVKRLPGLLVLGVVRLVMLGAALLACFFPVIGMSWALAPLMNVYVIEDVGIGGALKRSFKLSFGNLFSWPSFYAFWRWAGIVVVTTFLITPLSGLVGGLDHPSAREWIDETLHWSEATMHLISIVVGSLLLGAATAVHAGIQTAYYLDLRVRRDGLDLNTWLARLRGDGAGTGIERSAAP